MACLVAIYKTPKDKAAFDTYYEKTHVPLAKKVPGLAGYEVSRGAIAGPGSKDAYLVAVLSFASKADMDKALASPEGKATAADLSNFATGGVDLLMFDSARV